jgi:AcrR family transcriptional regulator
MKEKRRKKQRRTKERILLAARELAQQNGFEKLSLRGIARRVDYSPAALYEYFESKDAIIDALCGETDQRLADYMVTSSDPSVIEMACKYIEFAQEFPDDFQLLYRRPMLPNQKEQVFAILREQIKLMRQHSSIDNSIIDEITYAIWSMAHGIALLSLNREQFSSKTNTHKNMFQQLLNSYQ